MMSKDDVYANLSEFTRDIDAVVVDVPVEKTRSGEKKKTTKSKEKKKKDKGKDKSKTRNKKDRVGVITTDHDSQCTASGGLNIGADVIPLTTNGHERSPTVIFENRLHEQPSLMSINQSVQPGAEEMNDLSSSNDLYEELPSSPDGLGNTSLRLPDQHLFTNSNESTAGRALRTSTHTGICETVSATDVPDNELVGQIDVDRVTQPRVINTSPDKLKQQFSYPTDEYNTVNRLPVSSELRTYDVNVRQKSVDNVIKITALDARSQTPPLSAVHSSSDSNGNDIAAATTPTSGFVDGSIYSNCGEDVLGSRLSLAFASSTGDESPLGSRHFCDVVTSTVVGGDNGSRHVETVNVVLRNPISGATDGESCNDPGPAYVAMYQYEADDSDYNDVDVEEILTFEVHDVIYFLGERRGRWMRGQMRNSGEIGWFPSTHVREGISAASLVKHGKYATVSGASDLTSKMARWQHHQTTEQAYVSFETDEEFDDEYEEQGDTQVNVKYYVALYPYTATHDGDVTFAAGDVIRVLAELDNGWWEGTVVSSNQTGIFPGSYVKSVESNDIQRLTKSATDLSMAHNSQLSLANGHEQSSDTAKKQRAKKATHRKSTNVLSNFFSTLPRRFNQQSTQQLSLPSDHSSMTSSSDNEQKSNIKQGKKRPPMLPEEWMHSTTVSVTDPSHNDVETTPEVVRNAASGKGGSKASRPTTSMAVSVQLNRMLSKQKAVNTGSVSNRKKDLSTVDSPEVEEGESIKYVEVLPRVAVTDCNDVVATSPVAPFAGVFKKNQQPSIESRHLFTGKAKGSPVQKKPVTTDRSISVVDGSRIDKPEVVNSTQLQRRSMSASDLTRLDASTPSASTENLGNPNGYAPSVVDVSTEKDVQPQLNEVDGVSSQRFLLGAHTNERVEMNITSQPLTGSVAPPVAVKTTKRSSINRAQSFNLMNADVEKRKRAIGVESKRTLSPVLPDQTPSDIHEKQNGSNEQPDIPSSTQSAPRIIAKIRAPRETVKLSPNSNETETATPRKNTDVSHVESNGKGSEITVHDHSTAARRATKMEHQAKPLLPPKPASLKHKTFVQAANKVHHPPMSSYQPTMSINQCHNADYVKLQVRPEFVAPFAKPPRLRQQNPDVTEAKVNTQLAPCDVREAKTKPKPVSVGQKASNMNITNVTTRRSDISTPMGKSESSKEQLSVVSRGTPPAKEKPLPLKPKPKLTLHVVDFELST